MTSFFLLFALQLVPVAECSIDIVGTAEVYFIAHYNIAEPDPETTDHYTVKQWHEKPMFDCRHDRFSTLDEEEMLKHVQRHTRQGSDAKIPFRYLSPIYSAEDQTISPISDWFPVAFQLFLYNKTIKLYEVIAECGDIPPPCTCIPWEGVAADPEACSLEVPERGLAFLVAYYLHEHPTQAGMRYFFQSKPQEHTGGAINIDREGYPVGVEWFTRAIGETEFQPAGTCGIVPNDERGNDEQD